MLKNEGKKTFFKRVFIYLFLTMFIVFPFIAVVFASAFGGGYNSSRSNTVTAIMLEELGVDEAGRERIFEAFDREIDAYAGYNDAMANTIRNMKEVGMKDDEIDRVLAEVRTGATIQIPAKKVVRFKAGADLAKTVA